MTLTDVLMVAAALWLLFVFCGRPGRRSRTPVVTWAYPGPSGFTPGPRAELVSSPVWGQDAPLPRSVPPVLPHDELVAGIADGGALAESLPDHVYASLGSAPVYAMGLPQVLSLTEVTIEPGRSLTLAELGGSGLVVLEAGRLELAEREGDAVLTRSPRTGSPSPRENAGLPTVAPGDRLAFGPGATIVLRNGGENPARLLTASVGTVPGLAA